MAHTRTLSYVHIVTRLLGATEAEELFTVHATTGERDEEEQPEYELFLGQLNLTSTSTSTAHHSYDADGNIRGQAKQPAPAAPEAASIC